MQNVAKYTEEDLKNAWYAALETVDEETIYRAGFQDGFESSSEGEVLEEPEEQQTFEEWLAEKERGFEFAFISDTHGMHSSNQLKLDLAAVGKVDFLIHAGDCTAAGSQHEAQEFINWFSKQNAKYKIFIAGNHDRCFELKEKLIIPEGVYYLENSGVTLDGIKFWGTPITPIFCNWSFMADDTDERNWFDLMPTDTNVVISHGPPYGHLDINKHGTRCGSQALRERIHDVEPLLHVFGHIHEGNQHEHAGLEDCFGKTIFINASSINAQYKFKQHSVSNIIVRSFK